ncbi:glycosyltransferase, partial [Candidatus Sumerlaeota bacterium]|nr:glycosyltransferase [Candidatus Sumerlaeota bacterium]
FFGSLLGRYLRLPVVFDAQDESMAKALTDTYRVASRRRLLGRTAAWVDRWVVRKCDAIVASSTRIARSFIEGHGVAPEKVVVALDGVDTEMFHPRFADPNLKSELGLPRDCVLIAFVGLLEPHQGIDVMLEAFGHVAQQFPKAHLLVMGYPRVEEYRSKAEKPGLSGRVVFTGRMDYLRLPRFLASADIGIAPKLDRNESNGKVYNYMASGLPVVAFDTDVNREILDVLGDYAEYGSAEDLADAILTVCERDRERRVKKGRALRRRAEERFTWTRSAQRILDVYQWLVASGHRTAAEPRPPQADK